MKGRTPPPATIHVVTEGPKLTVADAIAKIQANPGFYGLETQHDAWCPFWRARRDDDCTCAPTYRLWALKEGPR
jgi:hypothetical protein